MYRTFVRIAIPDDFPPVYQDRGPILDRLRSLGDVSVHSTKAGSPAELLARLHGAHAIINVRAYTAFPAEIVAALPDLRLISIVGTGTDHIDLEACTDAGVLVVNTPGASTASVAELTIALMLAAARRIPQMDRRVRDGEWYHHEGIELEGKTLGLVGLGLIGQAVARIATGVGMRVVAWSFRPDPERAERLGVTMLPLAQLLREADVVSIHLRNSPDARGLIGECELALMKPGAVLVNTARGAIVDERALVEALSEQRIAGAGLDVFSEEPLGPGNPWVALDNVVLTPHVGWVTHEASERLAVLPVENVLRWARGEPANIVNPGALNHPRQREPMP